MQNYLSTTTKHKQSSFQQSLNSTGTNFNSLNGKMTTDYITQYPSFLKPNKMYPSRRIDDSHVKNAMEIALERYERDLLKQEENKEKHKDNLKKALQKEQRVMDEEREKKKKETEETKYFLQIQMAQKEQC